MEYNLLTNIESCYTEIPSLLYYSHIPPAIIVLLFGFFVLIKNKENKLSGILLFLISIIFSFWALLDVMLWRTYSSITMMSLWSLFGMLYVLIYILGLYFVYVMIDKKDISINKKYILSALLLPIIFLTSTKYNLNVFDVVNCEPLESQYFNSYQYLVGIIALIWIIVLVYLRHKKAERDSKKQVLLIGLGILSFLIAFSWSEIIGSLTKKWEVTQYGLFGMPVFMAFLAYLIVRYKAFNIKLIATQALIAALIIGIGSQFFFIQNQTNIILNGITLILVLGFGYMLVRSVKLEIKQREALEIANKEISERKEELQKISDSLSIANDKLHQLDKAKSEFISIASHQLRTPPTSIKGFGSLILEGTYGEISDPVRKAVEKMYISNERQLHLVEDLLNISRIEAGRMEFAFQPEQIENLVNEAVMTLELSAKNNNLYLQWQKPQTPLPKLNIDATKIKEVISNMVDNAVKYTKKGGVTVRAESDDQSVRIIVSDTGIGMDKEELENIFEKFRRGKDVSRHNTNGTGLGMFIAKKVTDAHKGKIWAESDGQGKGSRFILELPISFHESSATAS